jgi:hypothetical protein
MDKVTVKATRNFTVGPFGRTLAIERGEVRKVELFGDKFWTTTTDGKTFGLCCLDDGWELIKK